MGLTAKVLDTGEVVLPASVGAASGWKRGEEIEIVQRGAEVVVRAARAEVVVRAARTASRADDPSSKITPEAFFARVPRYDGPSVTDEDMETAVLDEARRRWHAKGG